MHSIENIYSAFLESSGICTDTRKLLPGSLFVALSGANFDGNEYAEKALEMGAAFALVSRSSFEGKDRFLVVENTLKTLQDLARHHRRQFDIPVLGITGSNGKTTSKELIAQVLKKRFKTHFTKGNFNNHIGVPLTLLAMPADTEFAIIEMGANHQGEIDQLCRIAEPNYGMITNIGKAHLEGFGGIEGVKKGKSELYRFLAETGGTAFLNSELPFLEELASPVERIVAYSTKGIKGEHSFSIDLQQADPNLIFHFSNLALEDEHPIPVTTHLYGAYNLLNINAAIAIAWHFGVNVQWMLSGIQEYLPTNNRSETRFIGSNKVLLDAYNANPSSMELVIRHFLDSENPKKVLILGDMLELGEEAIPAHQKVLDQLLAAGQQSKWLHVLLVGPIFSSLEMESFEKVRCYPDVQAAIEDLDWSKYQETDFLIKGSRSMRLEGILPPKVVAS
ncbi:MAG: UDP-N-acetylmuramoyl-tripeptide--D-alanyl-D-alanine ligase [Bacteroidota bacterium]